MFHVILHEPEIPPNTGNIIRLCANSGCRLHLVAPLGFALTDRALKRAGLDYHALAAVERHADLGACLARLATARVHVVETGGGAPYARARFRPGDALLFGGESRGLPRAVLERFPPADVVHIPMRAESRSVNLSNAVAIVVYEAWRQNAFRPEGPP